MELRAIGHLNARFLPYSIQGLAYYIAPASNRAETSHNSYKPHTSSHPWPLLEPDTILPSRVKFQVWLTDGSTTPSVCTPSASRAPRVQPFLHPPTIPYSGQKVALCNCPAVMARVMLLSLSSLTLGHQPAASSRTLVSPERFVETNEQNLASLL